MPSPLVRKLLIKVAAGEGNYLIPGSTDNADVGAKGMQHMQYLGAHAPTSPEAMAYIKQHNIPAASAKFYYDQGQTAITSLNDPNSWRGSGDAGWTPQSLIKNPAFQQIQQNMTASVGGAAAAPMVARTEFAKAHPFTDTWLGYAADRLPDLFGGQTARNAFTAGYVAEHPEVLDEVKGQVMQGAGGAFSTDSDLWRKAVTAAGTGYARHKFDNWFDKSTGMGNAMNGLANFSLGLASKVPGYDSAVNGIANWQYGDQFKQIGSQIANYGKPQKPVQPPAPTIKPPVQ